MAVPDFSAFRRRFPILASRVYVNSCSQGALSTEVDAALAAFRESWARDGSPWERWIEEVEALRGVFARQIGAGTDEIAIVPSASVGISTIASALDFSGRRSKVVIGRFEFPTMAQVWLAQRPRGARIAWVEAADERLDAPAYAAAIDEDTLVVPVTHVCFRNGFRLDVAAIAASCRAQGALVFLDDYQRTGTGPIDVHALGVDLFVTGAYKYLLGPAGVAFLYVRKALIERLTPTATGWFGRANPFAFSIDQLDWADSARRFETGTPPVASAYGALAALRLLDTMSPEHIATRIASLVRRLHDGLVGRGYRLMTPADPERRGPLVVVASIDATELMRRLETRGIICSARGRGLRIGLHAYNHEDDVDAVLDALADESALVERAGAGRAE